MRRRFLPLLTLPSIVVACGSNPRGTPDGAPPDMAPATTITITTGRPAALVAFRDGGTAPWQTATMKTPTSFEVQVHGPYLVSVVCNDMFTNPGGTFESWD